MLLFAQIQLHDHPSVFGVAEFLIAIAAEFSVRLCPYTYCSFRGRLFNCTCCTKDKAQRLCEDWPIKQDRCYIN